MQTATGNTLNDVVLDRHHYDFKMIHQTSYRQNHIIFLDYHEINVDVKSIKKLRNSSLR